MIGGYFTHVSSVVELIGQIAKVTYAKPSTLSSAISVAPACRLVTDVSYRVQRACRNQQFLARLRTMQLSFDLEFHFAVKHDYHLVGLIVKFSQHWPGGSIHKFATESAGRPISGYLLTFSRVCYPSGSICSLVSTDDY